MAKILVIEDEEDIRLNICELLSLARHEAIAAADGKQGIEAAKAEKPELIISDIMMPHIDGFGVLHILRKDSSTSNIPFIFLTSKGEINNLRQAMSLGASDYIIKPFEGSDLLTAVESTLNAAKLKFAIPQPVVQSDNEPPIANPPIIEVAKDPLKDLIESSDAMEYSRKQVIYKEGSLPRFLYYIKSGKVRTIKRHEDGKDLVMGLFGPNDFLGYAPLIEGVYHTETAETTEPTELVLIPKTEFEKMVSNHPKAIKHFVSLLAQNYLEKEEQLLGATYNTLRKKVAAALISLQKKYQQDRESDYIVNMSREELASIAGTATESLIRTLTEFKNEGLIEMGNGSVTIINIQKLIHLLR